MDGKCKENKHTVSTCDYIKNAPKRGIDNKKYMYTFAKDFREDRMLL